MQLTRADAPSAPADAKEPSGDRRRARAARRRRAGRSRACHAGSPGRTPHRPRRLGPEHPPRKRSRGPARVRYRMHGGAKTGEPSPPAAAGQTPAFGAAALAARPAVFSPPAFDGCRPGMPDCRRKSSTHRPDRLPADSWATQRFTVLHPPISPRRLSSTSNATSDRALHNIVGEGQPRGCAAENREPAPTLRTVIPTSKRPK